MRTAWAVRRGDLWRDRALAAERVLAEKGDKLEELEGEYDQLCDHLDVVEAANDALGEETEFLILSAAELRGRIESLEAELGVHLEPEPPKPVLPNFLGIFGDQSKESR